MDLKEPKRKYIPSRVTRHLQDSIWVRLQFQRLHHLASKTAWIKRKFWRREWSNSNWWNQNRRWWWQRRILGATQSGFIWSIFLHFFTRQFWLRKLKWCGHKVYSRHSYSLWRQQRLVFSPLGQVCYYACGVQWWAFK